MIPILLRWLACCSLMFACFAQAAILEVTEAERLALGSSLEYFLDEGGRLSLAEAMADARFRAMPDDRLALGYRNGVLWARVTLANPGAVSLERRLGIKEDRLERVSLFLAEPGGGYRRLENGLQVAVAERPVPSRVIAFPVRIEAGASVTLYLRVHTRTLMSLVPILWTPEAFERGTRQEELLAMLTIGALFGLGLYAVLLFPLRRDWSQFYLGLSSISLCLFIAAIQAYDHAYLWPDRPDWSLRATPVFGMLTLVFMNRVVAAFIPIAAYGWCWVGRGLNGLLLAQLLFLAGIFPVSNYSVLIPGLFFFGVVNGLFNLGIVVAALRKGFQPARYAVVGQLLGSVSVLLPFTLAQGWLPHTATSSQSALAAECFIYNLFFFAAISQRVDLLQIEKGTAQAEIRVAQQADQAKGEFLARVSHELRTPLHLILGYAHLLRRDAAGATSRYLALLEDGGQHLARLVDDLLDHARGERSSMVLDPKAAFLYSLLERIKAYGLALSNEHQHDFDSQFAEHLPAVVRVDAQRLEQVLLILLSNAAQHTRQGRISLSVQLLAADGARARLSFAVDDTGPGIAPANLERIFEPFERTAGGEHKGGLGLGLAIGRQIVRAMGGELKVDSKPGEGSCFWFELSLELAPEEEVAVLLGRPDILAYAGYAIRILVVEDHGGNRHLLEQGLEEAGFVVQGAGTVGAALALAAGSVFDLALLDQRLPDGSAWDILRVLRSSGSLVPAVLLSAQPPRPPADWGASSDFDAVLLKPVNGTEILECVGRVLGLAWRRAEENPAAPVPGNSETRQESPSPAECAELAGLVGQGAIYEVEEWIARLHQARPECRAFCREVEARLAVLDFEGIVARMPA